MSNPLIVTRHEGLREELLRLAAAAGVVPEIAPDPGAALPGWSAAPLVLAGTDVAEELVRLGPVRRPGLHLVGWGRVDDLVFRHAVALGAENVAELPRADGWLLELLAEAADGPTGTGITIGVVGGSGGAGATTFACALGLAAARRAPACLIDADPLGPGIDRVLGFDRVDGFRWDAFEQTTGRISARALREALPRRHDLGVLTWSPGAPASLQAFAVREALASAARGHHVVVVDLPRSTPLAEELLTRCDHLVVLVRGSLIGLASASRFVAAVGAGKSVGLVLRGADVTAGEMTRLVGAPVLATMPDQRGLEEAIDLGLGPPRSRRSALTRAAEATLVALGLP